MRIVRIKSRLGPKLGLWAGDKVTDLTSLDDVTFGSFIDLVSVAHERKMTINNLVEEVIKNRQGNLIQFSYSELIRAVSGPETLTIPFDPPEVWGCGITYTRSREAREFETEKKGIYDLVYHAERPEIFFKATASRCVGPNEDICIRGDSGWSVPEAELAFILGPEADIIGFTAGNDVSARDIEGENPLYLPQGKIFRACCALGPSIVTVDEAGMEPRLEIECEIYRSGERVFKNSTNTMKMRRRLEDLRSYLCRYNPTPTGTTCLTGTGIVPPSDFSLEEGDIVEITIEKVGTLRNQVRKLKE